MRYTQKTFHVAPCGSDQARDEYDRTFGPPALSAGMADPTVAEVERRSYRNMGQKITADLNDRLTQPRTP